MTAASFFNPLKANIMATDEIKDLIAKVRAEGIENYKAVVVALAKSYDVRIRSGNCRNCWIDALTECYAKAKKQEQGGDIAVLTDCDPTIVGYRFRQKTPVITAYGRFGESSSIEDLIRLKNRSEAVFKLLYEPVTIPNEETPTEAPKKTRRGRRNEVAKETPTETTTAETETEVAENEGTDTEA